MLLKFIPFSYDYCEEFYNEYNAFIAKYQFIDTFASIQDVKDYFYQCLCFDKYHQSIHYLIIDDNELIGVVEVNELDEDYPAIGIWIKQSKQKQGYAYKALNQMMNELKIQYKKQYVKYSVDRNNTASILLLKKFNHELAYHDTIVTESNKTLNIDVYILKI